MHITWLSPCLCLLWQVLLLSLLFTGYLVNIAAVTPVLQWVHYLSVFFFGFEALIVNEMSGLNLIFQARARPRSSWLCFPACPLVHAGGTK